MRELERKNKDFKISFKLNLCRAIISKFNFRFRNKLESLEIRQARVSRIQEEGGGAGIRIQQLILMATRHQQGNSSLIGEVDVGCIVCIEVKQLIMDEVPRNK